MNCSFTSIRKFRTNEDDNKSTSKVLIGIGAHHKSPESPEFEMQEHNSKVKPPILDKILVDLNNLPDECECPYGCKLDVYVTVRHQPGCPHKKIHEFAMGSKAFDFIGKGTYPYRQHMDGFTFDYCRKCDEFSDKCDKLLQEMGNGKPIRGTPIMTEGPFYQVIDEFAMVNTLVDDGPVSRLYQRRNFTKSEIDLYELDFLEGIAEHF